MTILLRFWPYLLGGALILGAAVWVNRLGYESGYNASEAKWRVAFDAANTALAKANERTKLLEAASTEISAQSERRYAETIASLNSRATDSQRRITDLVRQLAKRTDSGAVSPACATPAEPDAVPEVEERITRTGVRLAGVGLGCESDAAQVEALQGWIREQQALLSE